MFNFTHARLQYLWFFLTVILVTLLLSSALNRSIKFDADILNLLDIGDGSGVLTKVASQPFQNKAMLLVHHPSAATARAHLRKIKSGVAELNIIKGIHFNPSDKIDIQSVMSVYSDYPLAFLSDDWVNARDRGDYEYVVSRYMQILSQPSNPLISLSINNAPLLNLVDWFSARLQNNYWKNDQDLLYVELDGQRYYPLFLELQTSAVQLDQVVTSVAKINDVLEESGARGATIIRSGLLFHSAAVTERAQFEMQLFSAISLIGVLLLTLLSFRSLRPLLSIAILISASMLAGMTALVLLFEQIHILSLVFAISLIGIAVDYGYHILFAAKYTGKTDRQLAKHISPALLMGAGTTLLSYLLLLILPIPLLQQVAVFVGAGLMFAMFTGLTVITSWSVQKSSNSPIVVQSDSDYRVFLLLLVTLIACALWAVSKWHFEDDINIFNSTPQTLVEDEILVSKLVGNLQYPRFISVNGKDQQQVLQRFESVRRALRKLEHSAFELRGIDQWLPSIVTQQANEKWLRAGLENDQLNPITNMLSQSAKDNLVAHSQTWLTEESLPKLISQMYPSFIEQQDGTVLGILSYMGPLDDKLYSQLQSQLEFKVHYYDKPAQYSQALTKLRHYILYFLAMAVAALVLLMVVRYGLAKGFILSIFPVLTAFSALTLTQLLSGYVTIFNLLGCILILALKVDYIVFLKEHGRVNYVLKSILLSASTSALAFGIMIFSDTPAIWQFGLTVLLGVSIGWLLCYFMPAALYAKSTLKK